MSSHPQSEHTAGIDHKLDLIASKGQGFDELSESNLKVTSKCIKAYSTKVGKAIDFVGESPLLSGLSLSGVYLNSRFDASDEQFQEMPGNGVWEKHFLVMSIFRLQSDDRAASPVFCRQTLEEHGEYRGTQSERPQECKRLFLSSSEREANRELVAISTIPLSGQKLLQMSAQKSLLCYSKIKSLFYSSLNTSLLF